VATYIPKFPRILILESRFNFLKWLYFFYLCIFICIFAIRIYNGETLVLKSLNVWTIIFSIVVFAVSVLLVAQHLLHRYSCAKSNCGSENYNRQVISIARLYLFLLTLSLGDIVFVLPKLSEMHIVRMSFFLKGAGFAILALLLSNWGPIRGCIIKGGLWRCGKVIVIAILYFVNMIALFTEKTIGDIAIKDDWHVNAVVTSFLGVIMVFVYSLIFDWIFSSVDCRDGAEAMEMRRPHLLGDASCAATTPHVVNIENIRRAALP
jgi:hypothetical protein